MKLVNAVCCIALLCTGGCASRVARVTCPPLVEWPVSFQTQLASELEGHSSTEMPAFHELAVRAERQRLAVKGCK